MVFVLTIKSKTSPTIPSDSHEHNNGKSFFVGSLKWIKNTTTNTDIEIHFTNSLFLQTSVKRNPSTWEIKTFVKRNTPHFTNKYSDRNFKV